MAGGGEGTARPTGLGRFAGEGSVRCDCWVSLPLNCATATCPLKSVADRLRQGSGDPTG